MSSNIIIYTISAIVVLSENIEAVSRPSYIKPCRRDAEFDNCALEHAKYAIPFFLKGDRQFRIPNMNPLRLPLVDLQGNENFKLRLKNLKIYGLDKVQIVDIKADFPNQRAKITSFIPALTILADYELNGRILIFPINGNGLSNITLIDGTYVYDFRWDLIQKNGVEYAKTSKSSNYDYHLNSCEYRFENLFNGDKILGEEMNKFMNDNWMLINMELKRPTVEALLAIHNDVSSSLSSQIPYDDFFL